MKNMMNSTTLIYKEYHKKYIVIKFLFFINQFNSLITIYIYLLIYTNTYIQYWTDINFVQYCLFWIIFTSSGSLSFSRTSMTRFLHAIFLPLFLASMVLLLQSVFFFLVGFHDSFFPCFYCLFLFLSLLFSSSRKIFHT